MVIMIDIDGVVADSARAICEAVNRNYGTSAKPEDVITYNHDFGPITFEQAVLMYYPDDDFVGSIHPYGGAREFVHALEELCCVEFATAREHCHAATDAWIHYHFGIFPLSFVARKSRLRADYLVEDYPVEAVAAAKAGTSVFLITRPWNDNEESEEMIRGEKNVLRVGSFEEIVEVFKGGAEGFGLVKSKYDPVDVAIAPDEARDDPTIGECVDEIEEEMRQDHTEDGVVEVAEHSGHGRELKALAAHGRVVINGRSGGRLYARWVNE